MLEQDESDNRLETRMDAGSPGIRDTGLQSRVRRFDSDSRLNKIKHLQTPLL